MNLNGGTLLTGGFVKSQTGAGQTSTINFNGGTLRAAAANTNFLGILSGLTANVSSNGAVIDDNGFSITIGQPLIHSTALGATLDGGLTKVGGGILTLTAVETYNGPTTILGGRLAVTNANTLSTTTNVYVGAGAQLDVSGIPSGGTLFNKQKLWGNGSVNGNYVISNGAILSPGSNSIGALTFSNSLSLSSGSTNIFEITHTPLTNDLVTIFGTLTNGGVLIVTNIGVAPLASGDTFRLFDAGGYSGGFATVLLPSLSSGLAWNTNALNTNGTLSVIATVPPAFNSINLSSGSLVMGGTGGLSGNSYYVLTSTNLALPFSNWNRLATNQFTAGGNFNFTNELTTNVPQGFYLLQLP